MSGVRTVVLDIGNVLIEWQPHRFFEREIGTERTRAFFEAVDLGHMNDRSDAGEEFGALLAETIAAHPDWAEELGLWRDRWVDVAGPEIPRSVRLMRALRNKGVRVASLTNFGVQTYEMARARWPFLSEFDVDGISGHIRAIKPDAAIYEALEAKLGQRGDALLFADDRADNIAAAAARGWRTHLFEGPDGWADRLVAEGLLTEEEAR